MDYHLSPISSLLSTFSIKSISKNRNDPVILSYQLHVNNLVLRDYNMSIIDNLDGSICNTYPLHILILDDKNNNILLDNDKLKDLYCSSRYARVHGRFIIPILPIYNKYLCRSSTISIGAETLLNVGSSVVMSYLWQPTNTNNISIKSSTPISEERTQIWPQNIRQSDVELLNYLNIKYIFDLMVEGNKKVYGISVSSSEKVDITGSYDNFSLNAIPYPGCEFFKYYFNKKTPNEMFYDWSLPLVNSSVKFSCNDNPELTLSTNELIDVDWSEWKNWSLETLTCNYLLVLLKLLVKPDNNKDDIRNSVLIHCISGWDRTPLFASLIRLSLWADGLAHQSLNPEDMLYLTLAYDWFLFGHQFYDRRTKREDILYFCFDFLPRISDSIFSMPHPPSVADLNSITFPEREIEREPSVKRESIIRESSAAPSISRVPSHESFICVDRSPYVTPALTGFSSGIDSDMSPLSLSPQHSARHNNYNNSIKSLKSSSSRNGSITIIDHSMFKIDEAYNHNNTRDGSVSITDPSLYKIQEKHEYPSNISLKRVYVTREEKLHRVSELFKEHYKKVFPNDASNSPLSTVDEEVVNSKVSESTNDGYGLSNIVSWASNMMPVYK